MGNVLACVHYFHDETGASAFGSVFIPKTRIAEVLREAARWLERSGMAIWRDDELVPSRIATDVDAGLFFIAECDGEAAGVVKFQLEDRQFWPDVPQSESAFVHRLVVRRQFAGGGISALARSLPTPPSWVRATSILARAGFTTSTSASALRVRGSTLVRA